MVSRRFVLGASAGLAMGNFSGRLVHAQDGTPVPDDISFPATPSLPDANPRQDGELAIVTSTNILQDLVRQVGGARVNVVSLIPANADPHDFEPRPEDIAGIAESDLVVVHGLELDSWMDDLIDNSGTDAPVIVATDGIKTIASDEEGFGAGDPHVWFDPTLVKVMTTTIRDALAGIDPDGTPDYDTRLAAYHRQLDDLDSGIAARIALVPAERRKMVTNHDALAYFANRYGLDIVGTIIPGLDARVEPSAKEVAALIGTIKETGARAIFAENTVSPALAEQLAAEAGVMVVDDLYTDSLGTEDSGAETYIKLMQTDTIVIVSALK